RILKEDPAAQQQLAGLRLIAQHLQQRQEVEVVAEIIDTSALGVSHHQRKGIQQLMDLCRQQMVQKVLVPNFAHLTTMRIDLDVRSEREEHRERILEGLEEAKRQGKRIGRPLGSTEDRKAYLKKHASVVRQLRQGLSVRKTAKLCNVAAKTVSRVKALL
nr:hypothetical protein [Tanacetum cinerariifolium]